MLKEFEPPKNSSLISDGHVYEQAISKKGSKCTEYDDSADLFLSFFSLSCDINEIELVDLFSKLPLTCLFLKSFCDKFTKLIEEPL